ncbi:MAG: hypothetical protein IMY67_04905 [Bacteroidetes bacterium]|nr:hypothetical protein [Bacteroidota bacterium]
MTSKPLNNHPIFIILFVAIGVKPLLTSISVVAPIHYNLVIAGFVIISSILLSVSGSRLFLIRPLFYFILYLTFSLFWSESFITSISYYFKYLSYASIFFLVYIWAKNNNSDFLLKFILYSSLIPITYGIVQMVLEDYHNFYVSYEMIILSQRAIRSFFMHPNDFGVFLIAIFAVKLSFFIKPRYSDKAMNWIFLLGIVFFVYQTHARVAFAGFFVVTSLFFMVAMNMKYKIIITYFMAFILIGILLYFIYFGMSDSSSGKSINSLWWRFRVWGMLIQHVEGLAIFFGNGLGFSKELLLNEYSFLQVLNPHSGYIRLYLEIGIIGVSIYLYTLYYSTIRAYRIIINRINYSDTLFQLSFITLSINLSAVVMSITENILFNLSYQWILWTVNALFFVSRAKEKNKIRVH